MTRCALIMISNSQGKLALQKRSETDDDYPGCWDCSAGGTIDSGETELEAAHRELQEEIGIKIKKLQLLGTDSFLYDDGEEETVTLFSAEYNKQDFVLDPKEVSDLVFFDAEEIEELMQDSEAFHPQCFFILQKYYGFQQKD